MSTNQANQESARSQAWNTAIPTAEAGVEEALTHLNLHGATNLNCDGWQPVSGSTMYRLQRTIGDQTYLVVISNYVAGASANKPTIDCRGYSRLGNSANTHLARGIRVTTEQKTAMRGIITRGQLELQDVIVDSYDSSDPLYSSNGTYKASMAKDNGFLGSNSRSKGAVNIHQGTKIVGSVGTGASGVLKAANPTVVGDTAWVASAANKGKVQTNHLSTDLNVPFPNVSAPFSGGYFAPGSGTLGGTNYAYLLGGDYYQLSSLSLSGTNTLLVTGNATLYVTGSVTMSDDSKIIIAPGAKLNLYVGGTAFNASGNAQVNAYGTPSQLAYFGLPTNVDFKGSGNASLVGTFYAPNAHADIINNFFLAGAAMFDVLEAQHTASFHYDEALAKTRTGCSL